MAANVRRVNNPHPHFFTNTNAGKKHNLNVTSIPTHHVLLLLLR